METVQVISLMLGAGWASGINLYAAVLALGWLGATGQVELPAGLVAVSHPGVMTAAGVMFVIEFFADKVPGIDTGWDALHTFIRIPAGALLAAGAAEGLDIGPSAELIGLLTGGSLAATSHATKAGTRAILNTSPEPVSNWTASVTEDLAVFGGLWIALHHPWLFLGLLIVFVLVVAWALPKIWRALGRLVGKFAGWFKSRSNPPLEIKPTESERKHSAATTGGQKDRHGPWI